MLASLDDEQKSVLLGAKLNPVQQEAVNHKDGPLLVLAGAGTGKTRVLTTRIAQLINQGDCYPSQILAVTFTNKAAKAMRERVEEYVTHDSAGLWMGTFHSLCVRILRQHADKLGYPNQFTIIDIDDQKRLIKQLLKAENLDEKQFSVNMVVNCISRMKDKAKSPNRAQELGDVLLNLYRQYQERLKILGAMDFGDLLLNCLDLFQQFPDILQYYQQKFRYILVDEYQDTNVSQYLWLRLLAAQHQNLCCVGDDDQSIYGWRGAEVENILRFEKDFPKARVVRLEQNYRSTPHILAAASGLIAHNQGRLGKTLWTEKAEGEKVVVRGTWDSNNEARFVIEKVEQQQRYGASLKSMAILVRASYQTRDFEERCLRTGTPYKVVGGLRFYERQEIRDAIAYLRLLMQPNDGLAFERVVNVPKRGIGASTIQNMHRLAQEQGVSLPKAAHLYAQSPGKSVAKQSLLIFFENFERWRSYLDSQPHVEVVKQLLDESGYTTMWMNDKSPDAAGRLENLKELVNAIEEFEYLPGFLDHVSLVAENEAKANDDCLSIMTLHAAKGLEFDYVFLPGWEENLFPHSRCLQESGNKGLEEERRLGYVGISRAKKKAIISYALQRRMPQGWQVGLPSRFLQELPEEHIDHVHANGQPANDLASTPQSKPQRVVSFASYQQSHFKAGDRVFHQKFGYGDVIDAEGDSILVEFDIADTKKVHASYLEKHGKIF